MTDEPSQQGSLPVAAKQETLLDRIRSWRQKPRLTREQALQACPIRNPSLKWRESDDEEVTVTLPRREDWVGKLLAFCFYVPESRPLTLDVVGSYVWHMCDGDHTVADMACQLAQEHKLHPKEAEVSLTTFLRDLGKRGMIVFAVPREFLEPASEEGSKSARSEKQERHRRQPRWRRKNGRRRR